MSGEKRLYDEAAERLCTHAETCQGGCTMARFGACSEGRRLVAAENAAWDAYRRAVVNP